MNHNRKLNKTKWIALSILFGMVIFGCAPKEPTQQEVEKQESEVTFEESPSIDTVFEAEDMDTVVADPNQALVCATEDENVVVCKGAPDMSRGRKDDQSSQTTGQKLKAEDYESVLEVTQRIKLGESGTLKVWIGMDKFMLEANEGMARKAAPLYSAYTGAYARITPVAKDFTIESKYPIPTVVKIDSTGTEVLYTITPQKKGKFEVSADIDLFDNRDCVGDALPKQTKVMKVKVRVDYLDAIWVPVWEAFKRFWGAFVALFFGALLFVIRKYIKKKTGYSEEENEKAIEENKTKMLPDENKTSYTEDTEKAGDVTETTEEENLPADE